MRSCRIEATRRFEGFVAAKRRIDPSPEASNATVFRQIADAHFPDTLRLAAGDPTLIVGAAGNCSEFSEFSAVLPVFRLKGANRHDFPLVAGIRVTPSDAGSAQFLFQALRQRFLDDCLIGQRNGQARVSQVAVIESKPMSPRMSSQDIALANQTFQNALEKSASGNRLAWRNPGTGHSGSITPQKTYRAQNGLYCRIFDETVVMTKNPESFRNTACRDRDGVWKPI